MPGSNAEKQHRIIREFAYNFKGPGTLTFATVNCVVLRAKA